MTSQDCSSALVEPLWSGTGTPWRGTSTLHAKLIHPHAVGQFRAAMHRVTILRSGAVRQPGARYQTTRCFVRVIKAGQNPPAGLSRVEFVILQRFAEGCLGNNIPHRPL